MPVVAFVHGIPVDEERITAAETELGRRLPPPLRARLGRENGGEVEANCELGDDDWQLYPVWDNSDRKRARRTANHVVRETAGARAWEGFPQGAIAIASNGTGDRLVVLRDTDVVAWWDHETGGTHAAAVEWD